MERYAARVFTSGFDDGDIEGPYYRYFYAEDRNTAENRLRKNHLEMFEDIGFLTLSLSIKCVGKSKKWYMLFDETNAYIKEASEEHERQIENLDKYCNIYGLKE